MLSHVPQPNYRPKTITKLGESPTTLLSSFYSNPLSRISASEDDVITHTTQSLMAIDVKPTPFQDGTILRALSDANNVFVPTVMEKGKPSMVQDSCNQQGQAADLPLQDSHLLSSRRMHDGDPILPTNLATNTFRPVDYKCFQHQKGVWEEHFQDLLRYKQKHGNCHIPQNYPQDLALARWARRQRHQYKRRMQNKRSSMTNERQYLLEQAGFVWDPQMDVWEVRRQELEEYKRMHGNCNVPSRYAKNPQLASWVKRQRRQYKQLQRGPHLRLPRERFEILAEMGFVWNIRSERLKRKKSVSI